MNFKKPPERAVFFAIVFSMNFFLKFLVSLLFIFPILVFCVALNAGWGVIVLIPFSVVIWVVYSLIVGTVYWIRGRLKLSTPWGFWVLLANIISVPAAFAGILLAINGLLSSVGL